MNRRWLRWAAGALTALALTIPAHGAGIKINGEALSPTEGWIENGTSYITLRAFCQNTDYNLSWDGSAAHLTGNNLALSAAPGALYVEANGRALYVGEGVQVNNGASYLPLRVLAEASGASIGWDGASGTATLSTKSANTATANYQAEDLYWLSRVISSESRGEPLLGQIAVGNVVLNRVRSTSYPNTIKEVVFDSQYAIQFEPVANGTIYQEPTQQSVIAAKLVLEGASVVGECVYFFAPALSSGNWIVNNCTYYTTIGCHRFYLAGK